MGRFCEARALPVVPALDGASMISRVLLFMLLLPVFMLLLPVFAGPAAAEVRVYGCVITPRQESAPNSTGAFGGGQFVIDTANNTMAYHISFTGLAGGETTAHIHGPAAPWTDAPILLTLPVGNPKV